jgi:hypothetical protein
VRHAKPNASPAGEFLAGSLEILRTEWPLRETLLPVRK